MMHEMLALPKSLPQLNRRHWLQVSSLGWLGAALPFSSLGQLQAGERLETELVVREPIKSCILVFHYGGPSQFGKPLANLFT